MMGSEHATSSQQLRRRLLAGTRLPGESALTPQDIEDSRLPQADDLLAGLDAARQRNMDDAEDTNRAFSTVAALTETALTKLEQTTVAPISVDEILAVEAVIRADGSRPSLIVEQGWVDVLNPFALRWADQLVAARDDILRFSDATGRIQPTGGGADNYFGSGFYASLNEPMLLTNRHVALLALRQHGTTACKGTLVAQGRVVRYQIINGLEVDFNGELTGAAPLKAKISEIRMPVQGSARLFGTLDIAVMVLSTGDQPLPTPISIARNSSFEQVGSLNSFCALGFPAAPVNPPSTIDWGWVDRQLFQETYGVKRLAPGQVHHSAGTVIEDAAGSVLGHDATTLGGNSGSGLFAWLDGSQAFALHFAGRTADSNYAHGFSTQAVQTLLNDLASPNK
ncbi:hypothetical protein ACW9I5_02525 [Pseudomonas azotoformans]